MMRKLELYKCRGWEKGKNVQKAGNSNGWGGLIAGPKYNCVVLIEAGRSHCVVPPKKTRDRAMQHEEVSVVKRKNMEIYIEIGD